jgi:AbrB family looped-hinge helix DNA binding protein
MTFITQRPSFGKDTPALANSPMSAHNTYRGAFMEIAKVIGSRGRITVPPEFRERLGLKPGDHVEFIIEGGSAILRRRETDAVSADVTVRTDGGAAGFSPR